MSISYKIMMVILLMVAPTILIDARTDQGSEYAYIYNLTSQKVEQGFSWSNNFRH